MYQQPPAAPVPPMPPVPPGPPGAPVARGNWMAVTALVIGIVSLLLAFLPIINNFAFFLAIAGLGFALAGWVAARGGRRRGKGMAIASVVLAVLAMAGVLASQAFYANAIDQVTKELSKDGYVPAPGESGAAGGVQAGGDAKDVKITSCEVDEFGFLTGEVKIVNHDAQPRTYMVTGEAVRGSERIAELHASASEVRPGQSATTELTGMIEGDRPGTFRCRIVSVDSF